jgi:hypothetical protein
MSELETVTSHSIERAALRCGTGTLSDDLGQSDRTVNAHATWIEGPPRPMRFSQRFSRLPWSGIGLAASIIGSYAILCILLCLVGGLPALLCLSPFLAIWVRSSLTGKAPESVREMMDFPSPEAQFPVQVRLLKNRRFLGKDQGVVTFSDDLLHFEGLRVSFDVPNDSTMFKMPSKARGNQFASLYDHGPYTVKLSNAKSSGGVEFQVYQTVRGVNHRFRDAFEESLIRWRMASVRPHENLALPPFTPRNRMDLFEKLSYFLTQPVGSRSNRIL